MVTAIKSDEKLENLTFGLGENKPLLANTTLNKYTNSYKNANPKHEHNTQNSPSSSCFRIANWVRS
jgi:hypothetical protein